MEQTSLRDKIDGDKIIIYDNSGRGSKVIKQIVFVSPEGVQEYRIQKSKNRKYLMQK